MNKSNELTGIVFGKWTVLQRAENNYKKCARWLCKCECGKEKVVYGFHLTSGKSKSCGCANYKNLKLTQSRHGMTGTKIYEAWTHLRSRCSNTKDRNYKSYGGRGIKVCKEWDVFENFYNWSINNGFKENLSIDRIDNDGNYEPNNCRWTTNTVQQNNRRVTKLVTISGITKSLSEWSLLTGIPRATLYSRISKNYSTEKILTKGRV